MKAHAAAIRVISRDLSKMRRVTMDGIFAAEFGGTPQIDLRLKAWFEAKAWRQKR